MRFSALVSLAMTAVAVASAAKYAPQAHAARDVGQLSRNALFARELALNAREAALHAREAEAMEEDEDEEDEEDEDEDDEEENHLVARGGAVSIGGCKDNSGCKPGEICKFRKITDKRGSCTKQW